jgi:hypothetical protein
MGALSVIDSTRTPSLQHWSVRRGLANGMRVAYSRRLPIDSPTEFYFAENIVQNPLSSASRMLIHALVESNRRRLWQNVGIVSLKRPSMIRKSMPLALDPRDHAQPINLSAFAFGRITNALYS